MGVNLSQNGCFRKSDPFSSEDKFIFKKDDGSDGLTFTSAYTVGGLCCTVWYYQRRAKNSAKTPLASIILSCLQCASLAGIALSSARESNWNICPRLKDLGINVMLHLPIFNADF